MHRLSERATRRASAVALLVILLAPLRLAAQAGPDASTSPGGAVGAPVAPATPASTASSAAAFVVDDMLDLGSYNVGDLTADGRWLAVTTSTRRDGIGTDFHRDGDPTYIRPGTARVWVIDTQTGDRRAVFPDRRQVRNLVWSPEGERLAMLVRRGLAFEPVIWDLRTGRSVGVRIPASHYVAENSDLAWTPDGSALVLALRDTAWRREAVERFTRHTRGPVFVQSSEEPFLAWEELRRMSAIRSVVSIGVLDGMVRELIPRARISSYALARDGRLVTWQEDITKKTDYETIFGTENRLLARQLDDTATARELFATLRGISLVWSADGRSYAWQRDGRLFVGSVAGGAPRQLAGPAPAGRAAGDSGRVATAPVDTSTEARERRERERFSPVRVSPQGDALLVRNSEGLWLMNLADGAREMMLEMRDTSARAPRRSVVAWSEDGRHLYVTTASRTSWERGILRYDRRTKELHTLVSDARIRSGLQLAKDGGTVIMSVADGNRPADLWVADAELAAPRRLLQSNPQLAGKRLGRTELLGYRDVDGREKHAVVHYPADYVAGERYPTIFIIYEEFFDDTFDAMANFLNSNGYVVVKPSVTFETGYPGEAWLKAVTAAANKLIDMGVADPERLGVHGTSYGGYATNLLITQTSRFKAAINISGKVDIISFYTDSPRLGVRNVHAAERSQDRIGATLWEQPQKYVQHSAVMFADRIRTPLLLLTGEQDHNVPAGNTREMYYALRRLGRTVEWVNYLTGGHGVPTATVEEFTDFHRRVLLWYDRWLKTDPKPKVAEAAGQGRE